MVFTTQIFLFVFFPLCIASYILVDRVCCFPGIRQLLSKLRIKELIIIAFSFLFYMWACFDDGFRLLLYILVVYLLAQWIAYTKSKGYYINLYCDTHNQQECGQKRLYLRIFPLVIAVVLITFCLIYLNYFDFIIAGWNKLFNDTIASKSLIAPLGLSFITFLPFRT